MARGSPGQLSTTARRLRRIAALKLALGVLLPASLLLVGLLIVATLVSPPTLPGDCAASSTPITLETHGIPKRLVPIYERAAERYSLGPRGAAVLAAINRVETDFGRNLSRSSAGAVGWMQFMPATWATYGVDADRDGRKDPDDPWDAIFAAASYLRASGAPSDFYAAVFAYNHADWYVQTVLRYAASYGRNSFTIGDGAGTLATSGGDPEAACDTPDSADASGRLAKLIADANRIDRLHLTYVYGGGHVTPAPADGPFDCSSTWSRLLQAAGFGNPTMTSTGFMTWGKPGPGKHVTIYADPIHVYGTIDGRAYGTSTFNPGGGPGWVEQVSRNPYRHFAAVRHPAGM